MVPPLTQAAALPRPTIRLPRLGVVARLSILLILAALVIRLPHIGNPIRHLDDQFYLFTGRALLEGQLPYVDIWDRKPLGLFLIYGAIALLGGSGVIEYQLVAASSAAATAILVALIARRFTSDLGAALAGVCYLASLEMLGGGGGQSPVFYNLYMAGAALLVLRAIDEPEGPRLYRYGLGAMLLAGLSVFIKQSAVIEGCFFGLALLWIVWTRTGSPARVARCALLYGACGIAPTLLALLGYAALGHGEEFWFANFVSIFLKGSIGARTLVFGFAFILICLFPLLLYAPLGLKRLPWRAAGPERVRTLFLAGWLAAALLGFLAIPNFFDHYALPLLVPLSVAAAPLFGREHGGRVWAAVPILWALVLSDYPGWTQSRLAARQYEQAADIVAQNLRGGCLYVHEGPVQLYTVGGSCGLTRYVFPDHLNSAPEAGATGVDAEAELRRILARQPRVIVTARRVTHPENRATLRILGAELPRRYRLVAIVPIDLKGVVQRLHIWVRSPSSFSPESPPPPAAFASATGSARRR